jgi:hypothetical protein
MAIENTDLLVAYRPAEQKHYKVSFANMLPNGIAEGDVLVWDGNSWKPQAIDGGEYAT